VILVVVLAVVLEFVLRRTAFGRSLYVIGLNETAGRMSGLAIRRVKLIAFALCGGTAALAGLIMTSRTGSTVASAGAGMEFDSIIAAVLGGTSLFGGHGGALRTLVGVLVLGVLNNLLILLSVPIEGQQIAKGLVFLAVVWADSVLRHP
jgi:ribose/xylose/arabinose/galactoside ABC-type transport system permease subunit